jgi:RHS repeat-associated protein
VTRVFDRPVNFRDVSGRWRAIDDSLVARGAAFVNRAGSHHVALSRQLSAGVQVSVGSERLGMRLVGASASGVVRGARATYADALPGVSVVYDFHADALAERLVIADARAPRRFTFELTASRGLRARADRRGQVVFSRAGRTVFTLPASVVFPGRQPGHVHAVRSSLRRVPGGWRLAVTPDRRWVLRALRSGPVVLDPTVILDGATLDCRIENLSFANTSYCSDNRLEIGSEGGGDTDRSLLRFDLSGVLPSDAVVLNADLGLLQVDTSSSSHAQQLEVHRLTRAFTSAVTWNKYDGTNAWTTAGGDYDAAVAATATAPATNGWVDWFPTRLVQGWVDGSIPNYGVAVKATDETTGYDSIFFSTEGTITSQQPELDIIWAPRTGRLGSYTFDSQRLTDRSTLSVNVANGNLLLASDDLRVSGTGLDLDLTRYHNSLATGFGLQGVGIPGTMSLGRDVKLTPFPDGSVGYYQGDGVAVPFLDRSVSAATASFSSPPDLNATLTQDTTSGSYTLMFNRSQVRQLFNSAGQLTAVKDRNDNTIALSYTTVTGHGLSGITDTQGRSYSVDQVGGDGYISAIHDPTGRGWSYTYGATDTDYLTDYLDPAGKHTLYGYDSANRLTQITTAAGNVTKISYDGTSQRVASVVRTTDTGHTTGPTTSYAYSTGAPCTIGQNKTVVTDPDGHATTYCANVKDQVVTAIDALGNNRAGTYTPNGDGATVVDTPGGTGPAGTQTFTYDLSGATPTNNLTDVTGAEGEKTHLDYYSSTDSGGGGGPLAVFRPKDIVDDQGTSEFYAYDTKGNLTNVKDAASAPRNQATLTYNVPGNGVLTAATDGNGNTTTFGHDSVGNLTSITPPTPLAATLLTVDGVSRVHTVQAGPSGVTKTLTYDNLDRVTRVALSDGSYFAYTYDADGNLTQRSDSAGNTTTYTVDPLGRRTHEGFPSSRSNDYTYDNAGNLKTIVDSAGTVTYSYDAINRVSAIVSPTASGASTDTVSYSYDDPNRTKTMTLPGSTTEKYSFDKSGDTTNITVKNSAGTVLRSLAYDYSYLAGSTTKHGALIHTVTDQSGQTTSYSYKDAAVPEDVGRLVSAHVETSGHALVDDWHYTYDAAGNRTKLVHQNSGGTTTTTMAYNAANELCWKYTGISSNTCSSAPSGATSYSFDNRGNQTAAGSTSYSYDNYDRATSLAGTSASYLTPDNTELVAYGTTAYQNNLLGLSREIGSSTTTNYVRDPSGTPSSQRTSSAKQFFLNDALGSTIALTDSSGSIVRSYAYDPDGNASTSGSGATTSLEYAGGHQTGALVHFAARYVDPGTARWTQADPIRTYTGLSSANRYCYAGGDPVNASDPTGMQVGLLLPEKPDPECTYQYLKDITVDGNYAFLYFHDVFTDKLCDIALIDLNPRGPRPKRRHPYALAV